MPSHFGKKQPVISRLKTALLDSGLQHKDSALYQVINNLIQFSSSNLTEINENLTTINNFIGSGVQGPISSLNNAFALFDGITGKLIKDGGLTVSLTTQVSGDLSFANITQIATASILGRNTAGTGDIEVLTTLPNAIQDNITRLGTVISGVWNATDIAFANIVQIATASVLGRNTAGIGDIEVLSTLPNTVQDNITRLGTVVSGVWDGTDIAFARITPASAATRLLGRGSAAGAGDFEEITIGSGLTMTGTTLSSPAGDVVGPASSVNNGFALFDGITGKLLKDNGVTINLATQSTGTLPSATQDVITRLGGLVNGPTGFTAGSVIFHNGTTLVQDNANLFWDNTNKRLGIGTTGPARTLDVAGVIGVTDSTILRGTILTNSVTAGEEDALIIAVESDDIIFRNSLTAGTSEAMRIALGGNVGIGTTAPGARLEVASGELWANATTKAIRITGTTSTTGTTLVADVDSYIRLLASTSRFKNIGLPWSVTPSQLQAFVALTPKLWDYKDQQSGAAGFIAEELDNLNILNQYGRSVLINYDNKGLPISNRDYAIIGLQHLVLQNHDLRIRALEALVPL